MPLASRGLMCNWGLLFSCHLQVHLRLASESSVSDAHLQLDPRPATGYFGLMPLASRPSTCNWVFLVDATCKLTLHLQLGLLFFMPLASGHSTCKWFFLFNAH